MPLADIQFISDFAVYARGRAADEAYDALDPYACALGQFGHSCATTQTVPHDAFRAATRLHYEWTWGALADRLEALIADAPVVRAS